MSASLISTLSLITGPALLTNASAVLLLGATNRWSMAVEARRRVHRRIALLRRAMLLLQLAVWSFGTGTFIAMLAICAEQIAPGVDVLANPAVIFAAIVGGSALVCGVVTLFAETWSFEPLSRAESFAGRYDSPRKPSSGDNLVTTRGIAKRSLLSTPTRRRARLIPK